MKEELQEWESADGGEKRKKFSMARVLVIVIVVVVVGLAINPPRLSHRKPHDRTEAVNNAKQIGLALLEFEQEFGSFPSEETAEMVKKATGTELDLSGTSSNAMFRQLIAFGIQAEDIFYCKHPEGIRKPDRDISPGKALEAGEVGFSYI